MRPALNTLRSLLQRDPAAALRTAQQLDPAQEPMAGETDFIIGAALCALAREDEAEVPLRAALYRNPAHRHAGMTLAHMLRNQGRYAAAAATIEALVAEIPGDSRFAMHAIEFLRDSMQLSAAERVWVSTQRDGTAESSYLGGEIAMTLGDFAAAIERFERCLALDPIHPGAILAHAAAGPLSNWNAFAEHLTRLERERQRLPEVNRMALDFALGKLAMDRREFAGAFGRFDRANAAQRTLMPWNRAEPDALAQAGAPSRSQVPSAGDRGDEVVLIVGLPRSGTTLLASRLGQHPDIADRGECLWLGMVENRTISADMYLRHMRQDDTPRTRYLDKNPLNFLHLDTAARHVPRARILHCRRDPRDVGVSSYTQYFAHPDMAWSSAWDDILEFQRRYRALIARRPQDIAWHDIDYADLVADPEPTLRGAIAFLGLSWDERVLATSLQGAIGTASVWQARQPLHERSIGRWRETAAYTAPLIAAYGEQAEPRDWG